MNITADMVKVRQQYIEADTNLREAEEEFHKAEDRMRKAKIAWDAALHEFDMKYRV